MTFKDHDLTAPQPAAGIRYEECALRDPAGAEVPGLHVVRITLDNPGQLNSYTTEMVKGVILGMRRASNDRAAVAVVFTGTVRFISNYPPESFHATAISPYSVTSEPRASVKGPQGSGLTTAFLKPGCEASGAMPRMFL